MSIKTEKYITGLELKKQYNIESSHLRGYKDKLKWEYVTLNGKRQIQYLCDEVFDKVVEKIFRNKAIKKNKKTKLTGYKALLNNKKNSLSSYLRIKQ